ncbi:MAG: chromosome segregation protein SMC, partial [Gammaproteobacteria bacterium]
MRLSKIKLAGFKSFVDPAQVRLPSNLIGVVGPNGCGKSNIIDAVRWVLGESSAKHLRGAAMADVVFNGSNSRKPVGQASVELTFDNSDGRAGGEFAKFSEIAVRREVTRDGQSAYFLNGTRCRRRDITDLFLGTGLGPRSYAIIEQGMISRIIDAKPEELRNYLEEAAGISKYKERRRETENRIRHSRENMERLDDLRDEVDKQLQKLKRQSDTAEKYKTLKAEERRKDGELHALRLRDLEAEAQVRIKAVTAGETQLEAEVANQRRVERDLEQKRQDQTAAGDVLNEVQGRFYAVGAEIGKMEQGIQHARELKERQLQDFESIQKSIAELNDHFGMDNAELADLTAYLDEHQPMLEILEAEREEKDEARDRADAAMAEWQDRWESFNRRLADPTQAAQVQLSRADQLERQLKQHEERLARLQRERETLDPTELKEEVASLELEAEELSEREAEAREVLEGIQAEIANGREANHRQAQALDQALDEARTVAGRLASLKALQQAALGDDSENTRNWLKSSGLGDKPRLATEIQVDAGWERAVETVLGDHLEAVCADGLELLSEQLTGFESGRLTLVETVADQALLSLAGDHRWLANHLQGPDVAKQLLQGVMTADSLVQALALRGSLQADQSVITPEGIWMGRRWLRVWRDNDARSGVLERQQEIETLDARAEELELTVDELKAQVEEGRGRLQSLESGREQAQARINDEHRRAGDLRARLGGRQARLEQIQARLQRIDGEIEETRGHQEQDVEARAEARELRQEALERMEVLSRERTRLEDEVDRLRSEQANTKAAAREAREKAQAVALEVR